MTLTTRLRAALVLGVVLILWSSAVAQTVSPPVKVSTTKPKKETFKAEVLHVTRVAITVRSRDNFNLVRTFTYDPKLAAKMGKKFDDNKIYEHGDRVEIVYVAGGDTAVKIKGKPGQTRH